MTGKLTRHVLVPVADAEDARTTARSLEPYAVGRMTVLHVVEKGEGVPDKTPIEQSEEVASDAFAAVRAVFPDAETRTAYARDVVGTIVEVADEVDATAIAFQSRGGNRIVQFLAGDRTLKLVTQADQPVIALPRVGVDR